MSLYEWWGERWDPGEVGSVQVSTEHEACTWQPLVIARFVFVVVGLPALWYFTIPLVPLPLWQSAALVVGGTLIYVSLSYFIDPQPNTDNIGVAGGLIDHPFRYSDDLNRNLLGLKVLLGPGRFVAESICDALAPPRPEDPQEPESGEDPQPAAPDPMEAFGPRF